MVATKVKVKNLKQNHPFTLFLSEISPFLPSLHPHNLPFLVSLSLGSSHSSSHLRNQQQSNDEEGQEATDVVSTVEGQRHKRISRCKAQTHKLAQWHFNHARPSHQVQPSPWWWRFPLDLSLATLQLRVQLLGFSFLTNTIETNNNYEALDHQQWV